MIKSATIAANGLAFPALEAGDGPLVLLLHGFPDSPSTFAEQLNALAAAGYRAVAPTMRGYAPEAQPPDRDYHAARMVEDVLGVADALGADRFHLVGHDWGATIGFGLCMKAAERVASFAAIAVPHPWRLAEAFATSPDQVARSSYILEVQPPDMDTAIVADDAAWLEALWRRWSPTWDVPATVLAEMRRTFTQPGVAGAALQWYRQALDAQSEAGRESAALLTGPFTVPTLGIAGAEDGCIGADIFAGAMRPEDFPSGLEVSIIEGAGHFVHREAPAAVNAHLIRWLADHR